MYFFSWNVFIYRENCSGFRENSKSFRETYLVIVMQKYATIHFEMKCQWSSFRIAAYGDIWKCNCVTEMIFFSFFFVSWTYFSIFSVTKAQEYCPIVWFTIEKNRMRKSLTVFRWDAWEILLWCDMINLHSYNIQCSSLNIISNNDHMML